MADINRSYTGEEEAVDLNLQGEVALNALFEIRSPRVPEKSVPIFDDMLNAVVGYCHQSAAGIYRLYSLDGDVVGMEEDGLETPLVDPLDLIFFAGGIVRITGKGVLSLFSKTSAKLMASGATKLLAKHLAGAIVGAMRSAFRGLSVNTLKFTATTATRMAASGRHVPIHILHLALKYGKRVPDPQGAFLYTISILKNGKKYALDIVVREKDWTILHFLYK